MKTFINCVVLAMLVVWTVPEMAFGTAKSDNSSDFLRVYQVNKRVSDFPDKEDFSTPAFSYATINRLSASGEQEFWRRVTVKKLAKRMPVKKGKRKVSKTAANEWLNAKIIEVRVFRGRYAGVIAKMPHAWKNVIDYRSLELQDGQWLNAGNSVFGSLEKARRHFGKMCGRNAERPTKKKIDDPAAHLKPFIQFLKGNAEDPQAFVMKALSQNKVVIIGETHHRPRYWAFNSSMVIQPEFAKHVGTIYMELPSNNQDLIDKFLTGDKCNKELVIEMLRDMLWMGWPDQPMLDFFVAVWKVNRDLKPKQKLRFVLVDMERPWEKIQSRSDWEQYDVNRDKYMAENIIHDIQSHPNEKRNGLFIVGIGHTALNFDLSFFGNYPLETAGWHLQKKFGSENIYAIMQHRCVMTNMGRVDGRLQLGLFDSAFQAFDNKPMAFTLERGPFGEQMYDGQPDKPVWSRFRDGFNAYLYLGPLETEIFSPLIDGFYTDEFVKELERRFHLMYGKGWAETYGLEKSDAASFINWMSGSGGSWGRPRKWRNKLGPIDAWKQGDNWEEEIQKTQHKFALEHSEAIKTTAEQLFGAIRNGDYKRHESGHYWRNFLLPESVDYQVHHDFPGWVRWVCKTFKNNPITSVELGAVSKSQDGLPTVSYIVRLEDGRELKGGLPFRYMPRQGNWMGVQGIDWHLQYKDTSKSDVKPKPNLSKTEAKPASIIEITESKSVDRSSPEATVRSWTKAVTTGNVKGAMACMLPGGTDYEDVKNILNARPSSSKFFLKKMWLSIDAKKPIRILGKTLIEDETSIGWESYFKEDFTIKGRTFKRGDGFKFDALLRKHGDYWLIDNI